MFPEKVIFYILYKTSKEFVGLAENAVKGKVGKGKVVIHVKGKIIFVIWVRSEGLLLSRFLLN